MRKVKCWFMLFAICLPLGCSTDTVNIETDQTTKLKHSENYLINIMSSVTERTPRPGYCVRLSAQQGQFSLPGVTGDAIDGACASKNVCNLKANNTGTTNWIIIYRNNNSSILSDILIASLFSKDDCAASSGAGPLHSVHKILTYDSTPDAGNGPLDASTATDMPIHDMTTDLSTDL